RSGSGRILSGSGFKGGVIGHRRVPFECQINRCCWSGGTGARLPFRWPGEETGKILPFTIPPCPVDATCSGIGTQGRGKGSEVASLAIEIGSVPGAGSSHSRRSSGRHGARRRQASPEKAGGCSQPFRLTIFAG